ncbi:MAG: tRNA (cytidine(56)-2'-O)-methyltransferase [archaeon]
MAISILRLGHRTARDKRVSTHCALVGRAFGAEKIYYTGDKDSELELSVRKIVESWGGPFTIEHIKGYASFIKNFKGETIHLTMYGLPYEETIRKLSAKDKLIIVGGQKVPADVYQIADYNIGVTNQPHSEIAALAVLLENISTKPKFKNAKQHISPKENGKEVKKNGCV